MQRLQRERFENHQLQRALEEVGLVVGHASLGGRQKVTRTSVDRQEKACAAHVRLQNVSTGQSAEDLAGRQ